MNLKALAALFASTPPSNDNTKIFHITEALMQTMQTLGHSFPMMSGMFHGTYAQLKGAMESILKEDFATLKYFSGNGPISTRIREHLLLRIAIDSDFTDQPVEASGSNRLQALIDKLDFKPSTDFNAIRDMNHFLQAIPKKLKDYPYMMVFQRNPGHKLEDGRTGFYGDVSSSYNSNEVILRITIPNTDGVVAVFRGSIQESHQKFDLQYYHPYEDIWLHSLGDMMFPQMPELFEKELDKAIAETHWLMPDFDFEEEVNNMFQNHIEKLFDKADFLTQSLYYSHSSGLHIYHSNDIRCFFRKSTPNEDGSYHVELIVGDTRGAKIIYRREYSNQGVEQFVKIDPALTPSPEGEPQPVMHQDVKVNLLRLSYGFALSALEEAKKKELQAVLSKTAN